MRVRPLLTIGTCRWSGYVAHSVSRRGVRSSNPLESESGGSSCENLFQNVAFLEQPLATKVARCLFPNYLTPRFLKHSRPSGVGGSPPLHSAAPAVGSSGVGSRSEFLQTRVRITRTDAVHPPEE